MKTDSNEQISRLGLNLIIFHNTKARSRLYKEKIPVKELPCLSETLLKKLKFKDTEIKGIKGEHIREGEEEKKRAESCGTEIIFYEDEFYPSLLREIFSPPDIIYVRGNKKLLKNTLNLGIVGSRECSTYSREILNSFLPDICRRGFTVTSGMAYGVDSIAHDICLGLKGTTIGVNGGGLLHLYPSGNMRLINKILQRGAVISEFPLDTVPRPHYFPVRNRIISGISKGILVTEATLKSGSLITARIALEQNREVLAVPGNITSRLSSGPNHLIREGAALIRNSGDIFREFSVDFEQTNITTNSVFTKKERDILDLMCVNEVISIEYLVERCPVTPSEAISILMGLILKNIIIEASGGYKRIK